MKRTLIAKFLMVMGVCSLSLAAAEAVWGFGLRAGNGAPDLVGMVGIVGGFVVCGALLRFLFLALPAGRNGRVSKTVVALMAIGAALYGFTDFNLVWQMAPIAYQDFAKPKEYFRDDVLPWVIATLVLWACFLLAFLRIVSVIASSVSLSLGKRWSVVCGIGCLLLLVGLLGDHAARMGVPLTGLLWNSKDYSGKTMMRALAKAGQYVIFNAGVLCAAGFVLVLVARRLPKIFTQGICVKCEYPVSGSRCPECGTLQPERRHPPTHR